MGLLDEYRASLLASAAQAPGFDEVRAARDRAHTLEQQRLLALDERRAYAREVVERDPVRGTLAMMMLAPAEQAYKGVNHLMGREVGRSGFFAPFANIGAAYQGALEGMAMRGRK
jgi:hypothetical protein